MTKKEYLTKLASALRAAGVRECDDILEEYEDHFDMKIADGYGEEEVAIRLGPPEEIAAEFREITPRTGHNITTKIFLGIGLFFGNLSVVFPLFITLYAWIFTLMVSALSIALAGLIMVTGIDRIVMLEVYIDTLPMPYISALLLGLTLIALAVLAFVGARYCILYTSRLLKAYLRWHSAVWSGDKRKNSPPISLHPVIAPKKRRRQRGVMLISVLVFAVCLVAGYVSMVLFAGSFEPWHVWGWFM